MKKLIELDGPLDKSAALAALAISKSSYESRHSVVLEEVGEIEAIDISDKPRKKKFLYIQQYRKIKKEEGK